MSILPPVFERVSWRAFLPDLTPGGGPGCVAARWDSLEPEGQETASFRGVENSPEPIRTHGPSSPRNTRVAGRVPPFSRPALTPAQQNDPRASLRGLCGQTDRGHKSLQATSGHLYPGAAGNLRSSLLTGPGASASGASF